MSRFERASHVIWHCQYHLVWVPKYRFRMLQGPIGREVQRCVMTFCQQLGCQIGATEAVDIGADGRPEGTHSDTVVQCISEHAQEAVLGQSFLGQGLLRRYGRVKQ